MTVKVIMTGIGGAPVFPIPGGWTLYSALVSQTGTNDPTAIVLQNQTKGLPTFIRLTTGQYQVNFPQTLNINKTAPLAQLRDNNGSVLFFRTSSSTLALQTSIGGAFLDDLLSNTYIELKLFK